jgi:hypothetical protein
MFLAHFSAKQNNSKEASSTHPRAGSDPEQHFSPQEDDHCRLGGCLHAKQKIAGPHTETEARRRCPCVRRAPMRTEETGGSEEIRNQDGEQTQVRERLGSTALAAGPPGQNHAEKIGAHRWKNGNGESPTLR